MRYIIVCLFFIASIFPVQPLSSQPLYIVGGQIITMTGITLNGGIIRVEQDKITYVGRRLSVPQDALVIDAEEKFITPGFILAHSYVGVAPEKQRPNDDFTITPGFRVLDALNVQDPIFEVAARHGITSINCMPLSDRVIAGSGILLKSYGLSFWDRIVKEQSALSINLIQQNQDGAERTLASEVENILAVRNRLNEAVALKAENESVGKEARTEAVSGHLQVLLKVINQELPVMVYAQEPTEIERGISLVEDFDLHTQFINIPDMNLFTDRFTSNRTAFILEPDAILSRFETGTDTVQNTTLLQNARNFRLGLMVDEKASGGSQAIRHLAYFAARLKSLGLTPEEALQTITVNPARMLNVEDRLGTLEVGKDADINIFSDHPMDGNLIPDLVIVDGVVVAEPGR
ncbi:MAG: amidohydrolase family protein [Candidatus Marinimicrobia bacterium]|nr:amidohydrolase family protein [Candidatus Neomarinimicrobiota bacterium]